MSCREDLMFKEILIEKDLRDHPRVNDILLKFTKSTILWIDRYDDYWGKFKKPYLHKRDSLKLYLANKKGNLVKKTPDAYGINRGEHYYFIHAFNCIYECQYCYLQGYFKNPDIVLFLNHEENIFQMRDIIEKTSDEVWFHAGEYSDSLALSHLSGELPLYFDLFKDTPNAFLELRTKSANIKELLKLNPLQNVIVSFSLSPKDVAKKIDLKTPSISARLDSMEVLKKNGFKLAVHFDPIILTKDTFLDYQEIIDDLKMRNLLDLEYISLGVVRFTDDVYHEVKSNYPDSLIHADKMISSFDGKVRYPRFKRLSILSGIKEKLIMAGVSKDKIYFCME
jgi:spore photoproduct lyase